MNRASSDAARADRITRQMNRSSFMGIGDNPPNLLSEQDPTQARRVVIAEDLNPRNGGGVFMDRNQSYLNDESVPSGMYCLIDTYRQKARTTRPGDQLALLIDDFFGEAHAVLKDSHLREIARIRNENTVEIMKLKKVIAQQKGGDDGLRAPDHHIAHKVKMSFADNEVERQRRLLIEENDLLKKRLRACEQILASGTEERKHFMQGASWVAKKSQIESERHASKIRMLMTEFEARTRASIVNPTINEYNGIRVASNREWISNELLREAIDLNRNFEALFENVNYELAKAQQK